jgi:uncharacterized membrane protein
MYKSIFIFLIIDLIYFNYSKSEYESGMGIKFDNVKVTPAIISYVCLFVSYYFLVENPVDFKYLKAAIFGVGIYGVYNATNLAIFPQYTEQIAIRDTIWGISMFVGLSLVEQFVTS